MLRQGQLVGNALALYAIQGLNYLMPLLVLPFLLRALQPEGYGAIMFAQSLLGYAAIVVEFGFNFTAARAISLVRDDAHAVSRIYWTTTCAKLLLLLAAATIVAILVVLVPVFRQDWPLYAASGLLLLGNIAFPQWYFQGLERLRDTALIQAVAKTVVALAAIFLVRSSQDLLLAAVILSSPQLVGALAGWCLRKPLMPKSFHAPAWREIVAALQDSRHLFLANIATTLYLHTNTLVLGLLVNEAAVAMYSVASRVVSTVQGLAAPFMQAVFPRASYMFVNDRAAAWALCRSVASLVLPVMAMACLVLFSAASWVVGLLGGDEYAGAVDVLRVMSFVPLLVATAMILSQVIMVNMGLGAQLSRIYLTVGLMNLILLPLLTLQLGAVGAAMSLVIAELLGPIMMGVAIRNASRATAA